MSWVCLETNRTSRARKAHRCSVCDARIEPGEEQVTRAGVQPGEGYVRMHMHPECERYSDKWTNEDWECHGSGSVNRADVLAEMERRAR